MIPSPPATGALDPSLTGDVAVDGALRDRLVAIGSAFDAAPRSVVPEMHAPVRSRGRRFVRALTILALAGGLTGGAILATRPKTDDPIVGVIPKNLDFDDVESITEYLDNGGPRAVELLNVDGMDVLTSSVDTALTEVPWDQAGPETTTLMVEGHRVLVSTMGAAGTNDTFVTAGQWLTADNRLHSLFLRGQKPAEPALRRVVERTFAPAEDDPGIRRIAGWTESATGSSVVIGRSDVVVARGGVIQAGTPTQGYITSYKSSIPSSLVERVQGIRQPDRIISFRFGALLVSVEGPVSRSVRAIRRTELRRITKRVDRNHAKAIDPALWGPVDRGFDVGTNERTTCVRSKSDVACGQSQLNRLVGKQWVFSSYGAAVGVRADGVALRGYPFSSVSEQTVFLVPPGVEDIQASFTTDNSRRFTVTFKRPAI